MHKPNRMLEADVMDELNWDASVDSSRIQVEARDGQVTLSGVVPTLGDSQKAFDDARHVGGVTAVKNEIKVGPSGAAVEDGKIAAECLKTLEADRLLPSGAISVVVKDGQVTLRGEVQHHYQRAAAENDVNRIPGVLLLDDELVLTDAPIPSDVSIQIERALKRNAVTGESDIKVSRDGRKIILDGTVGSVTALDLALDTAWNAPGVTQVVNNLRLKD